MCLFICIATVMTLLESGLFHLADKFPVKEHSHDSSRKFTSLKYFHPEISMSRSCLLSSPWMTSSWVERLPCDGSVLRRAVPEDCEGAKGPCCQDQGHQWMSQVSQFRVSTRLLRLSEVSQFRVSTRLLRLSEVSQFTASTRLWRLSEVSQFTVSTRLLRYSLH